MAERASLLRALLTTEQWTIGIVDAPLREIVRTQRLPPVRWLPPLGDLRYLADPFAWEEDGKWHLLAEEMDYRRGRGRIVATSLDRSGLPGEWAVAAESEAHLSYPSLFRHAGRTCMAPESWELGRVEAWALVATPAGWRRLPDAVLPGVAAVDATLAERGGRWWLFCTDRLGRPDEDLLVFSAEQPHGPWTPHPMNPVKSTRRGARPAGPLFMLDGALHRPGQDSTSTYGGAIVIHRIDVLSSTEYREREICRLEPDRTGPWPDGIHSICAAGERTLIDGKRNRAEWWSLPVRLWNAGLARRRRGLLRRRAQSAISTPTPTAI